MQFFGGGLILSFQITDEQNYWKMMMMMMMCWRKGMTMGGRNALHRDVHESEYAQ